MISILLLLFPIIQSKEQNVKISVKFKPRINFYKKYIENENTTLSIVDYVDYPGLDQLGAQQFMPSSIFSYNQNKKESEIFKPEIAKADIAVEAALPISEKMKFRGEILLPLDDKSNFLKNHKVQLAGQVEYDINPYKLIVGISNNSRMSGLGAKQKEYIRGSDVQEESLPSIYEEQIGYNRFEKKIYTRLENESKVFGIAYHYNNHDIKTNALTDMNINQSNGLFKGKLPYTHDMIELSTKYTTDIGENSVFSISGGYNIGVKYNIAADSNLLSSLYKMYMSVDQRGSVYLAPLNQIQSTGLKVRRLQTFDIGTKFKYKGFEIALAYMHLGKSNKIDHKFDDILINYHTPMSMERGGSSFLDQKEIYKYDINHCTNNLYEIGLSSSFYNYTIGTSLLYGKNNSGFIVNDKVMKDKIVSILYTGDYKINDNVLLSVGARNDHVDKPSKLYSKNLDRILFSDVNLSNDNDIVNETTWTLSAAVKIKV